MKNFLVFSLLCIQLVISCSKPIDNDSQLRIHLKPKEQLDYQDVLTGSLAADGLMKKYNPEQISSLPKGFNIKQTCRLPFPLGQYYYYISKTDSSIFPFLRDVYGDDWLKTADSLYSKEWVDCVVSSCLIEDSTGTQYLVVDENNDEDLTNDPIVSFQEKTLRFGNEPWDVIAVKCNPEIEYYDGNSIKTRLIPVVYWIDKRTPDWLARTLLNRRKGNVEINGQRIVIELVSHTDIEFDKYSRLFIDLNGNGYRDENDGFSQLINPFNIRGKLYSAVHIDRFGKEIVIEPDTTHVPVLNDQTASPLLDLGSNAPDFKALTIDSIEFELSDFKDSYILLQFWAPWCGPCTKEIPHIINVFNKYQKEGLKIVSIGIDKPEKLYRYIKVKSENWIHISQTKNDEIVKLYRVSSIPQLYLLDKNGIIVEDMNSLSYKKLENTLEKYFMNF